MSSSKLANYDFTKYNYLAKVKCVQWPRISGNHYMETQQIYAQSVRRRAIAYHVTIYEQIQMPWLL